jgi:hypothetical protein
VTRCAISSSCWLPRAKCVGSGFERFLHILGRTFAEHRGYAGMLVGHLRADCGAGQLRTLLVQLLERAQAAGRIGAWVTPGDVMCCIWAIRGVAETSGAVAGSAWQRHLDIQWPAYTVDPPRRGARHVQDHAPPLVRHPGQGSR